MEIQQEVFKIICFLIVLYIIIGVLTKDTELTEGLFGHKEWDTPVPFTLQTKEVQDQII